MITDKHGNKKKKIINVISKGDVVNIKNKVLPARTNRSNYINDNGVRSGSPGSRNNPNMDQLYSASLKSNDPKEFLKSNFKNEMK